MSFLMRRTRKALAGWLDDFQRPNESPMRSPWGQWGDSRTVDLTSGGMVLGNDGGWGIPNPNGGIGYEHQPLTPNWVLEFTRNLLDTEGDGTHRVYIDRNWTAGVNNSRYQIYLELDRDTEREEQEDGTVKRTVRRRLYFRSRDTQGGFFSAQYGGTVSLSQAEWETLTVKLVVFGDSDFYMFVNGTYRTSAFVPDVNYRPGPARRASSFTLLSGPRIKVTRFATSDRRALVGQSWNQMLYDNFERPNSDTVGNGWSQGGAQFGIKDGALSMQTPFIPPGDGYRGIWRAGMPSGDMRVEVTLGPGGTGDPNDIAPAVILLRVNAAGNHALAAFIKQSRVEIGSINASIGSANPSSFIARTCFPMPRNIARGHKLAFSVRDNDAWVEDMGTGSVIAYLENAGAHAPASDTGYGAMVSRQPVFTNSVPFGDLRALAA